MTMTRQSGLIAVVDDDPDMRCVVKDLLLQYGFQAEVFASAEDFLATASTCRASCLIIDIQLGAMSGIELAHQLAIFGLDVPVIFMTGSLSMTIQKKAIEAGCVAYLQKPFPAKELMRAVKKAIAPKQDPSMMVS